MFKYLRDVDAQQHYTEIKAQDGKMFFHLEEIGCEKMSWNELVELNHFI